MTFVEGEIIVALAVALLILMLDIWRLERKLARIEALVRGHLAGSQPAPYEHDVVDATAEAQLRRWGIPFPQVRDR